MGRILSGRIFDLSIIVAAQLIAGLVFYGFGYFLVFERPLFNLSYLLVGFLAFAGRTVVLLAVMLIVSFDIVFHVNYGGMSTSALWGLAKLVPDSGLYGLSLLSLFVLGYSLVVFVIFYSLKSAKPSVIALSFVGVACVGYGTRLVGDGNVITLGFPIYLIKFATDKQHDPWLMRRMFTLNSEYEPMATPSYLNGHYADGNARVFSVIVESLGYPKNEMIVGYFEDRLDKALGSRFKGVSAIEYRGSTVNAEIRELCGLWMTGLVVTDLPNRDQCIPNLAKNNGVATAAFHNNGGGFYDRYLWYRDVGFDVFYDRELLISEGAHPTSHVFGGISDRDMISYIYGWASKRDSFFVHWMTLDGHGPYNNLGSNFIGNSEFDCQLFNVTNPLECSFWKLHDITISSIIELAHAFPDAVIIVSGDHGAHFQEVVDPRLIKDGHSQFVENKVMAFSIGLNGS